MNKIIGIVVLGALVSGTVAVADSGKEPPGQRDTNWGETTRDAIGGGFDQGGHASDPSGDGQGPGTADEPRSGLANAGGKRGDLSNTMDALGF